MFKSALFQNTSDFSLLFLPELLQSLQTLFGCVFLQHPTAPMIGFLPKHYFLFQNKQLHSFSRNSYFENYFENPNTHDLNLNLTQTIPKRNDQLAGFSGGYVGFIDYNYATQQFISSSYKQQPNAYIGQYETFLKFENNQWVFYSLEANPEKFLFYIQNIIKNKMQTSNTFQLTQKCQALWSKQQYSDAFHRIQEYIKAGDCYQINLTQAFTAKAQGLLLDTASQFWQLTNAPYSGYLKIDDFELLSCSPELFIEFEAERKILTKPIKGTMPRYEDPILDEQSKYTLIHSEKDQAENLMIVDLLRNDLSVYAETGSVKTPKLFNIESFNQVHHMVSEIEAVLKPNIDPFEMLLSALPGGSITGAPKIRAMQIIEELESTPRGAYCGSLGYFNFDGTGSWNILIRSIQKYQDDVSIWAGGGITIASDCDAEYQECFDKVSALLDLLNTWYQPETPKEKSES